MPPEITRSIDLPITPSSFLPLRSFLERCFEEGELSKPHARQIMVALDESISALLLRNHKKTQEEEKERRGNLSLLVDIDEVRLKVLLKDESDGSELSEEAGTTLFQQTSAPQRELNLDVLRHIMDEVHYTYRKGFQNELELTKFL